MSDASRRPLTCSGSKSSREASRLGRGGSTLETDRDILIAGAGIGGLATALALGRAGYDVRVFEAVPEIRPLGVGINLLPHAAAVLDELGLVPVLLEAGVETRELIYFNRHGQQIWSEARGRYAGHAAPQVSLSRGHLQRALLAAARTRLGSERIQCGRRLVGWEQGDAAIAAEFESPSGERTVAEGEALICADGIHSAARAALYPDEGPPVYAGRILWRATSRVEPFLTGASMIMAGHQDQKFVAYPIEAVGGDGLQRVNWIAELRVEEPGAREDWNREGRFEDFAPRFEHWKFDWLDVPEVIRRADVVYEYPLVDRDPVESWTQGRMTLLGDAAHPMYPIGSNGASQAILDSSALVRALSSEPTAESALAIYQGERLTPTAEIVRANRQNGPEHCMQLAEERAPDGFTEVSDVFAEGELKSMADRYKVLTRLKISDAADDGLPR